MNYYYCGHCEPDSRYRHQRLENVRRHITTTDDSRHRGHHGSDKSSALIYSLKEDQNAIPLWEGFQNRYTKEACRLALRAPHLPPARIDDLIYGEDSDSKIAFSLLQDYPWVEYERERLLVERTHTQAFQKGRGLATDPEHRAILQWIRDHRGTDRASFSNMNDDLDTDLGKDEVKALYKSQYVPQTQCFRWDHYLETTLVYGITEDERDTLLAAEKVGYFDDPDGTPISHVADESPLTYKPVKEIITTRYSHKHLVLEALADLPYSTQEIRSEISLPMSDEPEPETDDEKITRKKGQASYSGPSKGLDMTATSTADLDADDGEIPPSLDTGDYYDPTPGRDDDLAGLSPANRATIAYLRDHAPVEMDGKRLILDGEKTTRSDAAEEVGCAHTTFSDPLYDDEMHEYIPEPFGDWSPAEGDSEDDAEVEVTPTEEIVPEVAEFDPDTTSTPPGGEVMLLAESAENESSATTEQVSDVPAPAHGADDLTNDDLLTLIKLCARDSTDDEHDDLLEKLSRMVE